MKQLLRKGTVYLNLTSDPFVFPDSEWDRIVLELQAVKPEILEGEPVVLWGDTTEEIWRPPGERVFVLRHPHGLARLPVVEVAEQLRCLLVES